MQKYDTPSPITVAIDIPAGRLQLIAADRADTVVEIRPADPAKSRDAKLAEQAEVAYHDGVLRISARAPAKSQMFGPSGAIEVTVQLPAGSDIDAKAASAEFRAVGRLGDVRFDGAHGEIKIDEAGGAHLAMTAGDITIGRLTGPAEISADKGDIRVAEAVRGKVELRAQAGNLSIGAAAGASASLDAGTTYGRIRNDLKNSGTADLTIHATTAYGDIDARSL